VEDDSGTNDEHFYRDGRFMNKKTKEFIGFLQSLLTTMLTTNSEEGSGLGIFLRWLFRKRKFDFKQLIGINLAGFAFFAAIIVPQSQSVMSNLELSLKTTRQVIAVENSASPFQWPLKSFGISQDFSAFHPAMDLTDPCGTPIYPIANGTVQWIKYDAFGYGYHLLVSHDNNVGSLYAHMAKIIVNEGQHVNKFTQLGEIGLTGHTTGCHVHVEVYVDGQATNPLDVLPDLKDVNPTSEVQQ